MPNPFSKFKKKSYIEFAAVVCVIILVVVVLCLFSGGDNKNGLSVHTTDISSDSGIKANADMTESSNTSVRSNSDKSKSDKSTEVSENSETRSIQNKQSTSASAEELTKKKTRSHHTTTGTSKKSNNTVVKDNNFNSIDNFQKHMTSGLTADQAVVLNQILTGIENFETNINIKEDVLKKDDIEDLKSLFVLVKIACIENSSVSSSYKYAGNSEYITAIRLTYTKSKVKAQSEKNQLNQKVNSILKGMTSDMSEFEKVEYIHDSINKICVYGESETNNHDSAYGCLVEGQAVCEGYSKAFLLLCDRAGINSTVVTGTALSSNGESVSHMWNMVMIDGLWYHIDLTWDDPTLNPPDRNYVRYDFFNVTDNEISKTHAIINNKFYAYPKAYSTKHNYFVYYNYCASDYQSAYNAMEKAVADAVLKGKKYASIKLNSNKVFSQVKKKLFETSNGITPIFTLLKDVKKKTKADFSTTAISKIFTEQTCIITIALK